MRALVIAFALAVLEWHAAADVEKLFENERVIAWTIASGEATEPLFGEQRLPGVVVALADGAVRIVDDVSAVTTRDWAPATRVAVIALKAERPARLEIPDGLRPAFPRDGVRSVIDNDRVAVWDVSWTKGSKTGPHFHDKDVVAVYLDAGTVRSIALSGEATATPRAAGDTVFIARGRAHVEECIEGPRRDIIIELK
jgi:hypothetical protein